MDFNTSSDASLWQLAVVGRNEDACRELVGRHHPLVRGVCNQLLLCVKVVQLLRCVDNIVIAATKTCSKLFMRVDDRVVVVTAKKTCQLLLLRSNVIAVTTKTCQ